MRCFILAIAAMFLSGCSEQMDQPLSGLWTGFAEHEGKREEVELTVDEGAQTALLRIGDERLLRRVRMSFDGSHFSFSFPSSNDRIRFKGEKTADRIKMVAMTGSTRVPFQLRRVSNSTPALYAEEEWLFLSGGLRLSGDLLMPAGDRPHPAVVLIHGSSTPSREDFRFYADAFARCGIAALVYDKRPVAGADGVTRTDLKILAADARAAAEKLRADPRIDARRVGYWGHSQGGWVAPIAAAADPAAAFVISFSGPVASYAEVNRFADLARLRRRGFSPDEIDAAGRALDALDDYVRRGGTNAQYAHDLAEARRQRWASFTTLTNNPPTEEDRHTWLRWRNQDIDMMRYWAEVRAPVLALFGSRDDVVPVQLSVQRLRAATAKSGNPDLTVKIFDAGHTIEQQPDFVPSMLRWARVRTDIVKRSDCP